MVSAENSVVSLLQNQAMSRFCNETTMKFNEKNLTMLNGTILYGHIP
jgi:hypothetical protein